MRIGIVTISFNQAKFLQEAIDSVRVSDPSKLSYVIVDPGSTDESRAVIERNRDRFSHIILEPDRGPSDGLNKGFAACDADIFGYLNSDDRFVPGALDWVLNYFESHPDVELLLGAIRIIDENGRANFRGRAPDKLHIPRYVNGANFFWQQATFFRRELFERVGGFRLENKVWWDGGLVMEMAFLSPKMAYSSTILGDFRIYSGSITGSGRLKQVEIDERRRFQQLAEAAGYPPMSPRRARLERLWYKYNPFRHLNCTFGIHMPKV